MDLEKLRFLEKLEAEEEKKRAKEVQRALSGLENYSTTQLKAELRRRKRAKR